MTRKALDRKMEEGRNDLYVTLVDGKFSQGSKTAPKNVEVKMSVLLEDGREVPCLTRGTGRQSTVPSASYRSTVYYHSNTPTFLETVRMQIPAGDEFERAHLFFVVSHCKVRGSGLGFGLRFGFGLGPGDEFEHGH